MFTVGNLVMLLFNLMSTKLKYLRYLESRYWLQDPTKVKQYVSSKVRKGYILFILELRSELAGNCPWKAFKLRMSNINESYNFLGISVALSAAFSFNVILFPDLLFFSLHLISSPLRKFYLHALRSMSIRLKSNRAVQNIYFAAETYSDSREVFKACIYSLFLKILRMKTNWSDLNFLSD